MKTNNNLLYFFTTKDDGNIAYHVTDDKDQVDNAREELAKKHGYDNDKLQYMNQIHSDIIKVADNNIYDCDALITDKLNTPLMVMVADCIPILFYDDIKKVIAVAHAGRNGTFLDIASKTIDKMCEEYRCEVKDIQVELGPSIQKCCYEVSDELAQIALKNFESEFVDGRMLDLQGINKKQLLAKGIKEENITISLVCTKCSGENYFSYRDDKACGRFAGIIMMRDN